MAATPILTVSMTVISGIYRGPVVRLEYLK